MMTTSRVKRIDVYRTFNLNGHHGTLRVNDGQDSHGRRCYIFSFSRFGDDETDMPEMTFFDSLESARCHWQYEQNRLLEAGAAIVCTVQRATDSHPGKCWIP